MRSDAPALLPVLRSRTQAGILAATLLNADHEYTLTDLATRLGSSLTSVHTEVERLEQAAILTSRQLGRARLVRAGSGPLVGPLTELVLIAYGPPQVIAEEFEAVAGVGELLLFGSWAERYHGKKGHDPRDVDVLVVAASDEPVNRADVYAAAERAELRLARPVNPTVVSAARWLAGGQDDPLLQEIRTRPVVQIFSHGVDENEQDQPPRRG
ncbi:ArsR family transcriptional regulator [Saccharothrix stipae]